MSDIFNWPPPDHASGCVRGVRHDGEQTSKPMNLFHYIDGRGSQWGVVTKTYRDHGKQEVDHGPFTAWFWDGPPVPKRGSTGRAAVIWSFYDAPGELRALSEHGGDEDLLALLPDIEAADEYWLDRVHFREPSRHELPDGRVVFIWAHA